MMLSAGLRVLVLSAVAGVSARPFVAEPGNASVTSMSMIGTAFDGYVVTAAVTDLPEIAPAATAIAIAPTTSIIGVVSFNHSTIAVVIANQALVPVPTHILTPPVTSHPPVRVRVAAEACPSSIVNIMNYQNGGIGDLRKCAQNCVSNAQFAIGCLNADCMFQNINSALNYTYACIMNACDQDCAANDAAMSFERSFLTSVAVGCDTTPPSVTVQIACSSSMSASTTQDSSSTPSLTTTTTSPATSTSNSSPTSSSGASSTSTPIDHTEEIWVIVGAVAGVILALGLLYKFGTHMIQFCKDRVEAFRRWVRG